MGTAAHEEMPCPACHRVVSTSVLDCPSCGHPIKPASVLLEERLRSWAITVTLIALAVIALWRLLPRRRG